MFLTCLMHQTNDGRATGFDRAVFFATLRTNRVSYSITTPCTGFWYDDDGQFYNGQTTLVTMDGSEAAIRHAVADYGRSAGQLEMLLVETTPGYIVAVGAGEQGAADLAKQHGGATLLPDGAAISLRYASLMLGVDY